MANPITPHTEMINDLLKLAVESGASDIVIKSNKPGYVRLSAAGSSRWRWIRSRARRPRPSWTSMCREIFRQKWENDGQIDFAYSAEGVGPFPRRTPFTSAGW